MNIIVKNVIPLIKIGYWRDINRYYKVTSPLLEFYKGDDIELYFVIEEHHDPGLDPNPVPMSIEDIDIEMDIIEDQWAENDPILEYSVSGGNIVKTNPAKGY